MSDKRSREEWYAAMRTMGQMDPKAEKFILDAVADGIFKAGNDGMIKWLREKNGYPGATEASWEEMAKKNPLITRVTFTVLGRDLHIGELVPIEALGREIGPEMRVLDRYDETETYWLVPAEDVPLDEDG